MTEFKALDGIEYDVAKAGDLADLLSPPYDVISADARKLLADRSPNNIIHLLIPQAEGSLDRYEAAGRLIDRWRAEGVLADAGKAFYILEQSFRLHGESHVRTALLGRIRLGAWRESGVYPHEVTLPRPKADRLNLYRAARVQPGPIFTLAEDRDHVVADVMDRVRNTAPSREADGPEEAHDRIWKISDADTIAELEAAFSDEPLFIADGHHRYETALAYRNELAEASGLAADHPANFVLAAVVPMADPGLFMLPTHRLLKIDDPAAVDKAIAALEADYVVTRIEGANEAAFASTDTALYANGACYTLAMREEAARRLEGELGAVMAPLNVNTALRIILPRFFTDVQAAIDEERIAYTHEMTEAAASVDAGEADVALLMAPLPVETVAAVSRGGATLPPKSTYFYPKLPTGVVLNPLA
jgi:uncharacterized protein (DUF1015 family)